MRWKTSNAIELKDVWVKYSGKHDYALKGVTLDIPFNDFLVILGPNGAGKSTLLKTILGVIKPIRGEIYVLGKNPFKDKKVIVENIGYVPQRENVNEKIPIRVIDVVMMGIYTKKLFILNKKKFIEKALEVLNYVGLKDLAYEFFNNLSGGQKQRVLIARAIVSDPKIILLDEPFSALDAHSSRLVAHLLKKLNEAGKTIILVTHDLAPVMETMKRVALLNKELIAVGSPKDVLTPENLRKAYGVSVQVISYGGICYPILGDQHGP